MNKVKSFFSRCKVKITAACVAAIAAVTTAVSASAATTDAPATDMTATLTNAGEQIMGQFGDLVNTVIPVIIGILGSGLVIFGIFALIKLAKKIFGKVAG